MPKHRNVARDRAIGARVCLARVQAGMSRPTLGAKLGVTYQQVAKYEAGEVRVPASMLEDLAAALTVQAVWFVETDRTALARVELLELPKPGSVARRQLDRALDTLGARGCPPFDHGAGGAPP